MSNEFTISNILGLINIFPEYARFAKRLKKDVAVLSFTAVLINYNIFAITVVT